MSEETSQFLEIDRDNLDVEWLRQAKLYHKKAVQLAEAKMKLDEAKANLDVTTADMEREVRMRPEHYGIGKITEAAIAAAVVTSTQHQEDTDKVTKCKYDVAIFQAAVDALDHKKRALESLVSLALADYFATPRAPKGEGGREFRDGVNEKEKADVRSKGNRRVKNA